MPPAPTKPRWQAWLTYGGLALWVAGAVLIWYLWKRYNRDPGELVLLGGGWVLVLGIAAHEFVRGMFGPVFIYEITRLARKTSSHLLWIGYILVVSFVLLVSYWNFLDELSYVARYSSRGVPDTVPSSKMAEFAMEFFGYYMIFQTIVMAFMTPAYVAGSISVEKERKTLEFLLATDLRNHEIIFGKTAARIAFLLMFVLAGLPILALMQLFGGIDPDLLLSGTAAVIVMVLGLSAVSIAFSTRCARAWLAIITTFFSFLAYLVISVVAAFFFMGYTMAPPAYKTLVFFGYELDCSTLVDWMAYLTAGLASGNPLFIVPILANPFRAGGTPFAPDAVGTALFAFASFWGIVGTLAMLYAVFTLRSTALRQAYGHAGGNVANPKGAKKPRPKKSSGQGAEAEAGDKALDAPNKVTASPSDHPPIGEDPMFWKEVYVEGSSGRRGCFGLAITVAILTLVFLFPSLWTIFAFIDIVPVVNVIFDILPRSITLEQRLYEYQMAMIWWTKIAIGMLTSLAIIAVAVRGAVSVSGEHERDTYISLISAPLTSWEIIRAKWLGAVLSLRKLYFVMILVWGTALATGSMHPVMVIPSVFTTIILVSAFTWMGIFCSLTARNNLIATVRALLAALFFGGGFWLLLTFCCVIPFGLLLDRSIVRELDIVGKIGFVLLSGTPPYMAGFMPIFRFDGDELGPFDPGSDASFGPISFFLAACFWVSVSLMLCFLCWSLFAKQSNRLQNR